MTSYRRRPGFNIAILPRKVTRDETSDFVADLGHLEIEIYTKGI